MSDFRRISLHREYFQSEVEGQELPANRFVTKLIDNEQLLNRIKEILVDDTTI